MSYIVFDNKVALPANYNALYSNSYFTVASKKIEKTKIHVYSVGCSTAIVVSGPSTLNNDLVRAIVSRQDEKEIIQEVYKYLFDFNSVFIIINDRLISLIPETKTNNFYWIDSSEVIVGGSSPSEINNIQTLKVSNTGVAIKTMGLDIVYPFSEKSIWSNLKFLSENEYYDSYEGARVGNLDNIKISKKNDNINKIIKDNLSNFLKIFSSEEISADLSGGIDSTTLCFFLNEVSENRINTYFLDSENIDNRDIIWSNRAACELNSNHSILNYKEIIERANDEYININFFPNGPGTDTSLVLGSLGLADSLSKTKSKLHITGHGGDAVFTAPPAILSDLYASGQKKLAKEIAQNFRIPKDSYVKVRKNLRKNLDDEISYLLSKKVIGNQSTPYSNYISFPEIFDYFKLEAHEYALSYLSDNSPSVKFNSKSMYQIFGLHSVHGSIMTNINLAIAANGNEIYFVAPYLDKQILDISLNEKPIERINQNPPKRLLYNSRPANMSPDYFTRSDKGDYSAEIFTSFESLKHQISTTFKDGSKLAEMKVIDEMKLLSALTNLSLDGVLLKSLINVYYMEIWLRSLK